MILLSALKLKENGHRTRSHRRKYLLEKCWKLSLLTGRTCNVQSPQKWGQFLYCRAQLWWSYDAFKRQYNSFFGVCKWVSSVCTMFVRTCATMILPDRHVTCVLRPELLHAYNVECKIIYGCRSPERLWHFSDSCVFGNSSDAVHSNACVCVPYYIHACIIYIYSSEKANAMNKIQIVQTLLDTNLNEHNTLFCVGLDLILTTIHSPKPTNHIPFAWKWLIKLYLAVLHFLISLPLLPTN